MLNSDLDSVADMRELIGIYEQYLAATGSEPSLAGDAPRVKAELKRLREVIVTLRP